MNDLEQQLRRDIMRRVRFIHVMRLFMNGEVLKGMVFGASCFFVFSVTHVTHVVRNMSVLESWMSYPSYILAAYMQTSFTVQAIVVLAILAGAWLVIDMGRNVIYWGMSLREA